MSTPKELKRNRFNRVWVFILISMLILNGCTGILIKIAYNKGDWFIKNEIDKLFDITWNQDALLTEGLSEFIFEHRQNELPLIYTFMENFKNRTLQERITLDDIYRTTNEFGTLRNRMVLSLFDEDFTAFIDTLNPKQVNYFQEKVSRFTEPYIGDDGKSFRERSDRENHLRRLERRKKNIITWFGEVTPVQVKLLEEFPLFERRYSELFYAERKRIADQVIDQLQRQLRKETTSQETVVLLQNLFMRSDKVMSPGYVSAIRERSQEIQRFLVELHATLTPSQKKYLQKQVQYYQKVVSDLMEPV